MAKEDYKYIVLRFIEKFNERKPDNLTDLISDNIIFKDSFGGEITGKSEVLAAWSKNFRTFPDYKISITHIMQNKNVIALLGKASGTYSADNKLSKENFWEIPGAWKVKIHKKVISEWYFYADSEPVRKIISKYQ